MVALLVGVVVLLAEPPIEPNEKLGVPVAAPKRLPEPGAVDVVLLGALEELAFPKLNDILGVGGGDQLARIGEFIGREYLTRSRGVSRRRRRRFPVVESRTRDDDYVSRIGKIVVVDGNGCVGGGWSAYLVFGSFFCGDAS